MMHELLCCSLVRLTGKPLSLQSDHEEFLRGLKLGVQVGRDDDGLVLTTDGDPLVRDHEIHFPLAVPHAIGGLLPLLLFSDTTLNFTLHGRTHAEDMPAIAWYHELLLRYVRPYMGAYNIGVGKATFQEEGTAELRVQSTQKLTSAIRPLRITPQEELTHVAVEIIGPELETAEKLLALNYRKRGIPVRFSTRIAPFGSLTQVAFYGTAEGYDNATAFLQGRSMVRARALTQQEILAAVKGFPLRSGLLGTEETRCLLPIIALAGGSLPAEGTHEQYQELLTFLSEYLGIDFHISETIVSTDGYAALHLPEVVELQDI